jgi:hypothetical protein
MIIPAEQEVHAMAPIVEYMPAAQSTQGAFPIDEYVPAVHASVDRNTLDEPLVPAEFAVLKKNRKITRNNRPRFLLDVMLLFLVVWSFGPGPQTPKGKGNFPDLDPLQ